MKWTLDWLTQAQPVNLYPQLHAFVTQHNDRLKAFTAIESLANLTRDASQASSLALRGLPVGIKDIIDTASLKTEFGTPIYSGHQARRDAAIVSLLKTKGAVIFGKTTTTELAFLQPAGTLNPHLTHRTPGGSSSGSAAAVAAGWLPFAVGTQTGGSVIRPAAYCAIVGFKPSPHLLNMTGVNEFSRSLDTLGFFAPNMATMQFFCNALHPSFEFQKTSLAIPRIGYVDEFCWGEPDSLTVKHFAQKVAQLKSAGYDVARVTLPGSAAVAFDAHATVQNYEAGLALAWEWHNHRHALSEPLRTALEQGRQIQFETYQQAKRQIDEARLDMHRLFERVDLLLTPSAPGVAPDPSSTGSSSFNRLWTALAMPAITLPIWAQAQELEPLGLQLLAPANADASLLNWAAQLEPILAR